MSLTAKKFVIAGLSAAFVVSLLIVQWNETVRREAESGMRDPIIAVPAASQACVDCHQQQNPGIIEHWRGSTHAEKGVGCVACHQAEEDDADAFRHYGAVIATVVTPRDCSHCHAAEAEEFAGSHHARGGNILASLDNFLAETVEGSRVPMNPHGVEGEPGTINGMASAFSGCQQCHGSKVSLVGTDGAPISVDDLMPDANGKPTDQAALARIERDPEGRPRYHPGTWPNTGIGRINLDGSLGSCSACHSRHDFSPRRARQPENCGKCHLGPDHPQKEIFEESKHGVAYRDLKDDLNLDAETWVLGEDYAAAPTCATCHMSGHMRNGGKVTHDPGRRISWTNRPPVSKRLNTDAENHLLPEGSPDIVDTWEQKRSRMRDVCMHCHTGDYVDAFYVQYDDLVILYNEKFAKPGEELMTALLDHGLRTATPFDEEVEWTWFYLWHHEGRRARHGASMMAPDYTHWHGMFEVAERFYMHLVPQIKELIHAAHEAGDDEAAGAIETILDRILARPEHVWFTEGAEDAAERIKRAMEERYGAGGD